MIILNNRKQLSTLKSCGAFIKYTLVMFTLSSFSNRGGIEGISLLKFWDLLRLINLINFTDLFKCEYPLGRNDNFFLITHNWFEKYKMINRTFAVF